MLKGNWSRLMSLVRGALIILKKRYNIWRLLLYPVIWLYWFMIALIRGPNKVRVEPTEEDIIRARVIKELRCKW